MSWENETQNIIMFTSPEYNIFTAKWIANERSGEKKLGVFDSPMMKGSYIQDLNVKSTSYPLTVYFDGPFHYDEANKFWKALDSEIGQWEVIHPTKGTIILQLSTYKEAIDPTNSGNITVFETTWLEPANIERLKSSAEYGLQVLLGAINAIEDAVTTVNQLKADLYSAVQAGLNLVNKVTGFSNVIMSELAALDALVNDSWNEAKNTFSNAQAAYQGDPRNADNQTALAQSYSDIITIPLQASSDYVSRMTVYTDFINKILTLAPTSNTDDDYNRAVMLEIGAVSALMAVCQIISTSEFKTRAEIVSAMDNLTTLFNTTINALETVQELFE